VPIKGARGLIPLALCRYLFVQSCSLLMQVCTKNNKMMPILYKILKVIHDCCIDINISVDLEVCSFNLKKGANIIIILMQ